MNDPAQYGALLHCPPVLGTQRVQMVLKPPTMFDNDNEPALVNHTEPLPAIDAGSDGPSSDLESKRDRLRKSLSSSKLKGRLQDAGTSITESGHSLQDRLLSKSVSCHHNVIFKDQAQVQELAG